MNKYSGVINFIMALLRQYWKYKFRDIGMGLSTFIMGLGVTILMSGGLWNILIALDWLPILSDVTFNANEYSGFGVLLIIIGLAIGILRLIDLGKQVTGILIVHRGMEGMDTNAIKNALPKSLLKGRLDIIDLHEGHQLYEGKVIHPERALDVIKNLDQQIKTRLNGRDISEVKLSYGGLAPIPLLVSAGYKITSRQECLVLDYSRPGSWHGLDDIDDMEEISIQEPEGEIFDKVAIIMPLSVGISEAQLPDSLSDKSFTINLNKGARADSLNSSDKQIRVALDFYNLCASMKARYPDLKEIHLFIASQSSFAFRLGTMLTTSVMPNISIYQYDAAIGKYGWGVTISSGKKLAITNTSDIE